MKNGLKLMLAAGMILVGGQMVADIVSDGLKAVAFFSSAKGKVEDSKTKLKESLKSIATSKGQMDALKEKLADKSSTLTPEQRDALRLALLEAGTAPLAAFADFFNTLGKEVLAEFLVIGSGLNADFKKAQTFNDGRTMDQLLTDNITFLNEYATTSKTLLPKLRANLEAAGGINAKDAAPAQAPTVSYDDL